MATGDFPLSNLLDSTKALAVKLSKVAGELFTSTNPGIVTLSGSTVVQRQVICDLGRDLSGYANVYVGSENALYIDPSLALRIDLRAIKSDKLVIYLKSTVAEGSTGVSLDFGLRFCNTNGVDVYQTATNYITVSAGATVVYTVDTKPEIGLPFAKVYFNIHKSGVTGNSYRLILMDGGAL